MSLRGGLKEAQSASGHRNSSRLATQGLFDIPPADPEKKINIFASGTQVWP